MKPHRVCSPSSTYYVISSVTPVSNDDEDEKKSIKLKNPIILADRNQTNDVRSSLVNIEKELKSMSSTQQCKEKPYNVSEEQETSMRCTEGTGTKIQLFNVKSKNHDNESGTTNMGRTLSNRNQSLRNGCISESDSDSSGNEYFKDPGCVHLTTRLPYTAEEDIMILKFVLTGDNIYKTSSISLWKTLESKIEKTAPKRTYQSLKNRFTRNIKPVMFKKFQHLLTEESVRKIKEKYPEFKNISFKKIKVEGRGHSSKSNLINSNKANNNPRPCKGLESRAEHTNKTTSNSEENRGGVPLKNKALTQVNDSAEPPGQSETENKTIGMSQHINLRECGSSDSANININIVLSCNAENRALNEVSPFIDVPVNVNVNLRLVGFHRDCKVNKNLNCTIENDNSPMEIYPTTKDDEPGVHQVIKKNLVSRTKKKIRRTTKFKNSGERRYCFRKLKNVPSCDKRVLAVLLEKLRNIVRHKEVPHAIASVKSLEEIAHTTVRSETPPTSLRPDMIKTNEEDAEDRTKEKRVKEEVDSVEELNSCDSSCSTSTKCSTEEDSSYAEIYRQVSRIHKLIIQPDSQTPENDNIEVERGSTLWKRISPHSDKREKRCKKKKALHKEAVDHEEGPIEPELPVRLTRNSCKITNHIKIEKDNICRNSGSRLLSNMLAASTSSTVPTVLGNIEKTSKLPKRKFPSSRLQF